jgi:diacylglycerol kinase family enzyme
MALAPDASMDDGLLDVVLTLDSSKLNYLRAERPFRIYADGDPIGHTPATIRAVPGALRVLAPAS